jgi:hypothetical protein
MSLHVHTDQRNFFDEVLSMISESQNRGEKHACVGNEGRISGLCVAKSDIGSQRPTRQPLLRKAGHWPRGRAAGFWSSGQGSRLPGASSNVSRSTSATGIRARPMHAPPLNSFTGARGRGLTASLRSSRCMSRLTSSWSAARCRLRP